MKINEIFGPTIQGEGSAAGRHCVFIRLAMCNLECSWCDTPYTWAFTPEKAGSHVTGKIWDRDEQVREMSVYEVLDEVQRTCWDFKALPTIFVVSGGEPLIQQHDLSTLADTLNAFGNQIHIETAGTIQPVNILDEVVDQYNVSPKLNNSGNLLSKRYKPDVLRWFANNRKAWFKFVVTGEQDFDEIDNIVEECNIDYSRVMVMPEGVSLERNLEVAKAVESHAKQRAYGITLRTHIALWEDQRGN